MKISTHRNGSTHNKHNNKGEKERFGFFWVSKKSNVKGTPKIAKSYSET